MEPVMLTSEVAVRQIREEYENRYGTPRSEPVEAGRVRDFLSAMDESAELVAGNPVPPLFVLTLGRTRRPMPTRGSVVNSGDECEFLLPVYVGDTITVTRRVESVEECQGRFGRMFMTNAEIRYTNQNGELVAMAR